jgi:predicted choloylglycine hydrolase
LSANNNKPEIVDELFKSVAGNTTIVIAQRKKETALYHINGLPHPIQNGRNQQRKQKIQLSLFEEELRSPVPLD